MKKPLVFSLFREQSVFMTAIVAIMTFLAVIALGISLSIGTGVNRWNRQWDSFVTVQITNPDNIAKVKGIIESNRSRLDKVTEISDQEMLQIMGPWISGNRDVLQKYLPKMYEIRFKSKSDISEFNATASQYARVLTHSQSLHSSISVGWKIVTISTFVLLIILAAIGVCISFIARNIAILHKRELEILNQVGASDGFVAGQMQIIVTKICAVACGCGFVAALPVIFAILATAHSARVGLMAMLGISGTGWLLMILLPIAILAFAIIITKRTTLGILKNE